MFMRMCACVWGGAVILPSSSRFTSFTSASSPTTALARERRSEGSESMETGEVMGEYEWWEEERVGAKGEVSECGVECVWRANRVRKVGDRKCMCALVCASAWEVD